MAKQIRMNSALWSLSLVLLYSIYDYCPIEAAAAAAVAICVVKCFDILIAVIYRKVYSAMNANQLSNEFKQKIYCYCLTKRNRIDLKCR